MNKIGLLFSLVLLAILPSISAVQDMFILVADNHQVVVAGFAENNMWRGLTNLDYMVSGGYNGQYFWGVLSDPLTNQPLGNTWFFGTHTPENERMERFHIFNFQGASVDGYWYWIRGVNGNLRFHPRK